MTTALPAGQVELAGNIYMPRADGAMVPLESVKDEHRLQDGLVRDVFGQARTVSEQLSAFMTSARVQVQSYIDLVIEKYGAKAGPRGSKGNVSLQTYDGLFMVKVQIASLIKFDSTALEACQALCEECAADWTADSGTEVRAIVLNAFSKDSSGQMNRGKILGLFRYNFTDPRWLRAMDALRDAIIPDGTKDYLRFYHRPDRKAAWRQLSLDAATA